MHTSTTKLIVSFILLLGGFSASAQTGPPRTFKEKPKPVLLDKSALSGLGLQQVTLKDTPERKFFQKQLYRGQEISVYVVSSESWTVPFERFWFDEFILMYNGQARVKADDKDYHFLAGNYVFAPKNFPGEWEVKAGDKLHYELSVITNRRADSTQVSTHKHPFVLDAKRLSDMAVDLDASGMYQEALATGTELTVKLKLETPGSRTISEAKEQLICLLAGKLILKNIDGSQQEFFAGDYVVIPHKYSGHWTSEGHTLIRYLTVESTSS